MPQQLRGANACPPRLKTIPLTNNRRPWRAAFYKISAREKAAEMTRSERQAAPEQGWFGSPCNAKMLFPPSSLRVWRLQRRRSVLHDARPHPRHWRKIPLHPPTMRTPTITTPRNVTDRLTNCGPGHLQGLRGPGRSHGTTAHQMRTRRGGKARSRRAKAKRAASEEPAGSLQVSRSTHPICTVIPKLRARFRFPSPAPPQSPRPAARGLFVVQAVSALPIGLVPAACPYRHRSCWCCAARPGPGPRRRRRPHADAMPVHLRLTHCAPTDLTPLAVHTP